jgi:hypothetical protein
VSKRPEDEHRDKRNRINKNGDCETHLEKHFAPAAADIPLKRIRQISPGAVAKLAAGFPQFSYEPRYHTRMLVHR